MTLTQTSKQQRVEKVLLVEVQHRSDQQHKDVATIRVRFPLEVFKFSVKNVVEKKENKQKEAGGVP